MLLASSPALLAMAAMYTQYDALAGQPHGYIPRHTRKSWTVGVLGPIIAPVLSDTGKRALAPTLLPRWKNESLAPQRNFTLWRRGTQLLPSLPGPPCHAHRGTLGPIATGIPRNQESIGSPHLKFRSRVPPMLPAHLVGIAPRYLRYLPFRPLTQHLTYLKVGHTNTFRAPTH